MPWLGDLLAIAHDDNRAIGMSHAVFTHGTEEHADHLTPTTTTHYEQTGAVGCVNQHKCGVALHHGCLNGHPQGGPFGLA